MSPVHYVNIQKQQLNINSNNKNNCADYALVKCLFFKKVLRVDINYSIQSVQQFYLELLELDSV